MVPKLAVALVAPAVQPQLVFQDSFLLDHGLLRLRLEHRPGGRARQTSRQEAGSSNINMSLRRPCALSMLTTRRWARTAGQHDATWNTTPMKEWVSWPGASGSSHKWHPVARVASSSRRWRLRDLPPLPPLQSGRNLVTLDVELARHPGMRPCHRTSYARIGGRPNATRHK